MSRKPPPEPRPLTFAQLDELAGKARAKPLVLVPAFQLAALVEEVRQSRAMLAASVMRDLTAQVKAFGQAAREARDEMNQTDETSEPCRDCGAKVGGEHADGCDVARCLVEGTQRLNCELTRQDGYEIDHDDCGRDIWTGTWPGVEDCRRLGWWARERTDGRGGWERCGPDDEGATEDLNRLGPCGHWDSVALRWEARPDA